MKNIEIESRFRPGLSERFDAKNAKRHGPKYVIDIPCPLCIEYNPEPIKKCKGCPFRNFGGAHLGGCFALVREMLNGENRVFDIGAEISWALENDKKARAQIALLREEAGKRIKWV